MIRTRDLVKRFGETLAVDSVSFDVAEGEIVGFLGPNGAGKTTTLRILTCFMPATSGNASVAGFDVHNDSLAVRRSIGYLPENMPLPGEMRAEEYLHYRAQLKGLHRRGERKDHINALMDRCRVADVRRKQCSALSKGYRQRVGLADALIGDPKVLFLDEPTAGLDPNQIRETRQLIRHLGEKHTIMVSTHILPEVEMVCDRVLIIHNGAIAARGTPAELRREYSRTGAVIADITGARAEIDRALGAIAGVKTVSRRPGDPETRYRIETEGDLDPRADIARVVAEHGWGLVELRRGAASLEDVFTRITMREG